MDLFSYFPVYISLYVFRLPVTVAMVLVRTGIITFQMVLTPLFLIGKHVVFPIEVVRQLCTEPFAPVCFLPLYGDGKMETGIVSPFHRDTVNADGIITEVTGNVRPCPVIPVNITVQRTFKLQGATSLKVGKPQRTVYFPPSGEIPLFILKARLACQTKPPFYRQTIIQPVFKTSAYACPVVIEQPDPPRLHVAGDGRLPSG